MDRLLWAEEQARLRADFQFWLRRVTPGFTWTWPHLVYVQQHLQQLTDGHIKRLMLFMPPRYGKSELVTIRYPIWRLEREPTLRIIVGAYNQILANEFSYKARGLARSRMTLAEDRLSVDDWQTAAGGGLRAVGVGAGITGRGGDLIVLDDPVKSREEANSEAYRERVWQWYTNDIFTRLEPGGAMILIMTRWHEDDLAGRILASEDAPNWTVVSLPAEAEENDPLGRALGEPLCPARFDKAALAGIRRVLQDQYYALYQQRPQPPTGSILQREWFPRREPITRSSARWVIQAWDTAFREGQGADYSACVTLATHPMGLYVLHVWRGHVDFPHLLDAMRAQAEMWRPHVILVENKGSGTSSLQALRVQTALPLVPADAQGSKVERANIVTGLCQSRGVVIPATSWGDDLLDELLRFPTGKHDDQVDAFVYAMRRIVDMQHSASIEEY